MPPLAAGIVAARPRAVAADGGLAPLAAAIPRGVEEEPTAAVRRGTLSQARQILRRQERDRRLHHRPKRTVERRLVGCPGPVEARAGGAQPRLRQGGGP